MNRDRGKALDVRGAALDVRGAATDVRGAATDGGGHVVRYDDRAADRQWIRAGDDQALTDPCDLRFPHQELEPNAGGDHNRLPHRTGLATRTNPPC